MGATHFRFKEDIMTTIDDGEPFHRPRMATAPKTEKRSRQHKLKESQMAAPIRAWLCDQGLCVHYEVRLAAKRVDVVGLPQNADESEPWTGVELKLTKWKDALFQATANSLVFDYNYVALWHQSIRAALRSRAAFEEAGVGLMSVSEDGIKILIEPQKQRRLGQIASKLSVRARIP